MTLPARLTRILGAGTAQTWELLAPVLPAGLYLAGGTGLAVHLAHRESRDLDFFYHRDAVDLTALEESLSALGPFAVTKRAPGTLNGLLSATQVQFLHADEGRVQRRLEPTERVAGIEVAGVGDILAMKLRVIADRGELRDYFDLMTIELEARRSVEEGLALYLARYEVPAEPQSIDPIIRALGYLDDVDEDEALPISKQEIAAYWARRQAEVIVNVTRAPVRPAIPLAVETPRGESSVDG